MAQAATARDGIGGHQLPMQLQRDLVKCGLGREIHADAEEISAQSGAYLLFVGLGQHRLVTIGGKSGGELEAGWYVYCGSARGPGGLSARIGRHFRTNKARRWHIDQLTDGRSVLAAVPIPGGEECALAETLIASKAFSFSRPGFGSSDCGRCNSHLLRWINPLQSVLSG